MSGRGKGVYFADYNLKNEQWLFDSIITESINIHGSECYYCPRTINNFDPLYTSDDQSSYEHAFLIPIYLENALGFQGDGSLLGKFGIEIRDKLSLSISRTVFDQEIGVVTAQQRPNEGDLIYFPINNKCFQIKYVDKFEMFYASGALYTWKVQTELFEYSGEKMQTGIPAIDSLQTKFNLDVSDWALLTEDMYAILDEDGNYICIEGSDVGELVEGDISEDLEEETSDLVEWSPSDPFNYSSIANK